MTTHQAIVEEGDDKVFGFWIYLMTDLIIFAVLFAAFLVLRHSTFDGPSGRDLFHLPFVLTETLILLTSSFTCSLAMIAIQQKQRKSAIFWFSLTFILGTAFLCLEILEFSDFIHQGANWQKSAFLSSFFALVGTHGLHIFCGLIWIIAALCHLIFGTLVTHTISWIIRMALFWHFLDFVWIFIFTVVYGIGYLL